MDYQGLKLFLHLASTLHFGQTSEACFISPSTLSRHIKRLEDEVGKPLFERDKRKVSLTRSGELFRQYAAETLANWNRFQETLQEETALLNGEISMYCSVTASYSFLSDLLVTYRQRQPNVEVKLHTGDAAYSIPKVVSGDEDIVIAAKPEHLPSSLSFKPIATSGLVLIAPTVSCLVREFIEEDVIEWSKVPVIQAEQGLIKQRLQLWFRQQGIKPNVYTSVAGHEAIVSMVSLGFGIGIVPELVLFNSPLANKIQQMTVEPVLQPFTIGLCVQTRRLQSPLVKTFWDTAKALS